MGDLNGWLIHSVLCDILELHGCSFHRLCTKQSEFANHSDRPFIGSESHRRLVNLFGKRDMIPKFADLQELRRHHNEASSSSSSTYAPKKPFVKKDWKTTTIMTTILHDKIPIPTSPNLISVFLTFPSQAESQRRINEEGLRRNNSRISPPCW